MIMTLWPLGKERVLQKQNQEADQSLGQSHVPGPNPAREIVVALALLARNQEIISISDEDILHEEEEEETEVEAVIVIDVVGVVTDVEGIRQKERIRIAKIEIGTVIDIVGLGSQNRAHDPDHVGVVK